MTSIAPVLHGLSHLHQPTRVTSRPGMRAEGNLDDAEANDGTSSISSWTAPSWRDRMALPPPVERKATAKAEAPAAAPQVSCSPSVDARPTEAGESAADGSSPASEMGLQSGTSHMGTLGTRPSGTLAAPSTLSSVPPSLRERKQTDASSEAAASSSVPPSGASSHLLASSAVPSAVLGTEASSRAPASSTCPLSTAVLAPGASSRAPQVSIKTDSSAGPSRLATVSRAPLATPDVETRSQQSEEEREMLQRRDSEHLVIRPRIPGWGEADESQEGRSHSSSRVASAAERSSRAGMRSVGSLQGSQLGSLREAWVEGAAEFARVEAVVDVVWEKALASDTAPPSQVPVAADVDGDGEEDEPVLPISIGAPSCDT